MNNHEDTWGWMLATDFFFAGMGGGMLVIAAVADWLFGLGQISWLAALLAPVFIALGAGLLILELGKPFRAWRVFMSPKAILTIGAWFMLLAIGSGFIYASFFFDFFSWSGLDGWRKFFALASGLFGLVVAGYPGVLLGRHKARPFWVGPGIMVLFLLSSFLTGMAAHLLCGLFVTPMLVDTMIIINMMVVILLALQLLLWPLYIYMKMTGATDREGEAAQKWFSGEKSWLFWGGLISTGSLLPAVMFGFQSRFAVTAAAVLAVIGGLVMRLMVVYSGEDRTWLPGEEVYRSRLPGGEEAFLKAWLKE